MDMFRAFHQFNKFLAKVTKFEKLLSEICFVNPVQIMFQPSELTTATKVFIQFNKGLLYRVTMVQCIDVKVFVFILQKKF